MIVKAKKIKSLHLLRRDPHFSITSNVQLGCGTVLSTKLVFKFVGNKLAVPTNASWIGLFLDVLRSLETCTLN